MTSMSSSLLIQIILLRRISNVFTSVIYIALHLISCYSNNRVLSTLRASSITRLTCGCTRPTHQTRKPSYVISRRQKNPASRENYASELHQVIFQEWVGPLDTKWSAMVASTFYSFKKSFSSVWKTEVRSTCSRRLTQLSPASSLYLYIKWHFPIIVQSARIDLTPYTGAYANHYLSIFLYWIFSWICRKCLGSIWTFNAPRPQRHCTRKVALRFLKIITPVKCVIPHYDGYIYFPMEGELHRRSRKLLTIDQSVWSANIDKLEVRGLQLLWNAYRFIRCCCEAILHCESIKLDVITIR